LKGRIVKNQVISLYCYTGEAVRPWALAGFECHCFDIQHDADKPRVDYFLGGGQITYHRADLHSPRELVRIARKWRGRAAFMMAFPVCTDMAVSGAAHFKTKSARNPAFQTQAANYARWCGKIGEALGCPWFVENPVSVLSTLWRKSDHRFNPYQFGGYIPEHEAAHPIWPEYIAARDAYPKKTCLWVGGGFKMPDLKPVKCAAGYSEQHKKLGGKSMKTKNIRSATPRGFSIANFTANHPSAGASPAAPE
jgi:hypothetical protein